MTAGRPLRPLLMMALALCLACPLGAHAAGSPDTTSSPTAVETLPAPVRTAEETARREKGLKRKSGSVVVAPGAGAKTGPATASPPATVVSTPTTATPPAPTATTITVPVNGARGAHDSSDKLSGAAIALVILAGLLALGALVWGVFRFAVLEPHWLLSLRHALAEAGLRASAVWAEFTDWARLGH
jgi:hypothetical protein